MKIDAQIIGGPCDGAYVRQVWSAIDPLSDAMIGGHRYIAIAGERDFYMVLETLVDAGYMPEPDDAAGGRVTP